MLEAALFSPDSSNGRILHAELENLSDDELDHLADVYSDPAMFKFYQTQKMGCKIRPSYKRILPNDQS